MSGDGYYAISLNAPPRCLGTPHKHGTALARIGRGVVVDPFGPLRRARWRLVRSRLALERTPGSNRTTLQPVYR